MKKLIYLLLSLPLLSTAQTGFIVANGEYTQSSIVYG